MSTTSTAAARVSAAGLIVVVTALGLLPGCGAADSGRVQGYVEAEFVYVSSPRAGTVVSLRVRRGDQAKAGDPLFALDPLPEEAAWDEAARKLAQGYASWEDLRKSKRPSEIHSIEEQLAQARAALVLSEKLFSRQGKLRTTSSASAEEYDRARGQFDQDRCRVTQLEADLETARLPARSDQIEAAEANMRALEASLARAEWDLAQKSQAAPKDGLVFDTLFREGEWVPAGKPIVALLPPPNIKVRAYVAEPKVGSLQVGMPARVFLDGLAEPFVGKVSFISPQAEYTPPVIYSRESRSKLVFLIEVRFDAETAAKLHPGQPVDVEFGC
jgi:HlyD family secretion protein